MHLADFCASIQKKKSFTYKGFPGIRGQCPAHADKHPSFAAWEGADGFIHVNCKYGCSEQSILDAIGLTQDDRRIDSTEYTPPTTDRTTSVYVDKQGRYLFEKVRYYKDGRKTFIFQVTQKDGQPVAKINDNGFMRYPKIDEAGLGDKAHCLYNLPGVTAEAKGNGTIYFCNGEKAAEATLAAGHMATCLPHGEQSAWKPYYSEHMRGATVIIVAQRDNPGCKWARRISLELTKAGIPCRVVNSATTGDKDDAYEHWESGFKVDDFVNRPDLVPEPEVRGFSWACEIEAKPVEWLFKPYFALGTVAGIEGDPGIGKSLLAAAMACVASNGVSVQAFRSELGPINCLIYATEDSAEYVTVPRLGAMEGNLQRIALVDEVIPLDEAGLADIELKIRATSAKLVIIDPITAFIEAATGSHNAKTNVHLIMDGLKQIASRTGACIICIRHLHKANGSKTGDNNPIYAGLGSIAIIGKYRTCIQVRHDKQRKGYCNVTHIKTNLGECGAGFAYRIYRGPDDLPRFEWTSLYTPEQESEAQEQPVGWWSDME